MKPVILAFCPLWVQQPIPTNQQFQSHPISVQRWRTPPNLFPPFFFLALRGCINLDIKWLSKCFHTDQDLKLSLTSQIFTSPVKVCIKTLCDIGPCLVSVWIVWFCNTCFSIVGCLQPVPHTAAKSELPELQFTAHAPLEKAHLNHLKILH